MDRTVTPGFIIGILIFHQQTLTTYDNGRITDYLTSAEILPNLLATWEYYQDWGHEGGPRHKYEKARSLLLGLFAWGRVNNTRFVQVFFVPVSLGKVETALTRSGAAR
ncbi:MAG: hypothetical protein FJ290_22225 [Planctomycetes bacterium]|nr:hypothetical protein [Planctomycetota bacterium]